MYLSVYAVLQFGYDLEGGVDAHVGGDEGLFKFVEDVVVDGGFAEDGACNLGEEALLGLGEAGVEGLALGGLFFTAE